MTRPATYLAAACALALLGGMFLACVLASP